MIQVDDIVLHSKGGNNNSYNIDGDVNYINYNLDNEKQKLSDFIKNLIEFRKNIKYLKINSMLKIWNFTVTWHVHSLIFHHFGHFLI